MKRQLLKGFHRPEDVVLEHSTADDRYAKFSAYPFERGYGTTVGNSLRRILLSSIQGFAVTAFHVTYRDKDNVARVLPSEFQAIPNILEDTLEIIHNLKKTRIVLMDGSQSQTITLNVDTEGVVHASKLAENLNVSVHNPDQHILTATDGVNAIIKMQIEQGVGYRSIEQGQQMIETVGALPVDAIFSPVERVRFDIEDYRIDQRSDYEKLLLEVWTDGTVNPVDAVAEAAKIAKEHYTVFINFDESEVEILKGDIEDDTHLRKVLGTSIDSLDLSARAGNCLENAGILTIGELISHPEDELSSLKNFGRKSFEEIKKKLLEMWGLRLGMHDKEEIQKVLHTPPPSSVDEDSET